MRKRVFSSTVATLALIALVGLLAALAPFVPWPNLVRAHSPGEAALTALTVTAGGTAQTLSPTFDRAVYYYTIPVAASVTQITIEGTADGDGSVAYQNMDGTTLTDADATTNGQQVDLPALGPTRVNVVVSHTDGGSTTTKTYTVLVIREGTVATDQAALMALYNSTNGPNWTTNTDWGTAPPLNAWFGVTTNADGRVTVLGLGANNLDGTLPDELGNLTNLTRLFLYDNALSGTIPASLGDLTSLTSLELRDNALSGTIPASLGNLTSLMTLLLRNNELSGTIPDSLGNLASLQYLYLSGNALTGRIPDSLGNLASIKQIFMYSNALTGTIPDSLGNLASLQVLSMGGNELSGTIPDSLGNLASLQILSLWGNELSGRLPASLGNLTNLLNLDISRNNFDGPIPNLSRITNLQWVYIWDNQLSGTLPTTLNSLTNLKKLYLNRNALSGTIPDLSSLTSLTHLALNSNELSEAIPNSLGSLISLQQLYLHQNQLSGTIPDLSTLTSLTTLSLYSNELSGTIPNLSTLTSLQNLYLSRNELSGGIPATLQSLTNLQQLNLNHNQLSGTIPNLSSLVNLTTLSLRNNELTGPIPAWLGQLTKLEMLRLSGNQLSGEIPAELGSLDQLKAARFASNADSEGIPSLTGCVPAGLRYLIGAPPPDANVPAIPAQDFIAVDTNNDGDTDDPDDIPGLNLPFCMLSALTFSDVTLDPVFATGTVAYGASVANTVDSTTVTATVDDSNDSLSIMKGTASYASGESVPLDVGQNELTITLTPSDATLTLTYTVTIFRAAVDDKTTLLALYNSTGGASWTDKTNWGSIQPLDDWFGVTANGSTVTGLDLPDNNLSGTLPVALGSLTSLTTLDLSDNSLSGTIPDLSALTSLTILNLGDNQLSGTIPTLSALTSLTTLNLGDNQLSGTIPTLSALTSLTTLNLRDNRLTGTIPEELGNLTPLDILYLDDNQLSGPIPEELGNLSGLDVARFAGNTLTGCVPNGLRRLVTAPDVASLPAHDFIAVGGTPGLGLPFCTLSSLTFSDVILEPDFASDAEVYTASATHDVTSTMVTETLYDSGDTVSITKGADTYMSGDLVPLDVGPNVITIEITPADSTPTHTYTVTVRRALNAPPAFNEGPTTTRGVDENTATGENIGAPVAATDADNDTLTYSLDATSLDTFDIVATTGQLQTKADLDFEDTPSYTVTVSVSDSLDDNGDADAAIDNKITVTILVANINEAPVFPTSQSRTRGVGENTPSGLNIGRPVAATDDDNDSLTYSLDDPSPATFDIVGTTGQLKTKAALDYESTNSYSVAVTATDPSGEEHTITVTIIVIDAEEAGTVTLSPTQPIVGIALTATLDDPDKVSGSATWLWESSPNGTSSWTPISGATTVSYTPVTTDVGNDLRATASYDDGQGSGKSAQAVSANMVREAPTGMNERPVFPTANTYTRNVGENTPAGRDIGDPVTATDAETDPLTYSLAARNAAIFDINRNTGQLLTKAALDHETASTYIVDVTATDTAGGSDIITVTITVTNVEEPGTVTLSSQQPLVAIDLTASLDDLDEVSGSETWSWERSPDGASSWTPISGATSATYTPVTADVGNDLRATASYTDGEAAGKSAQAIAGNAVEVALGRNRPVLREYPTATRSVAKNTPAGRNIGAPIAATDADNDLLTYSLGGPDRASFDLTASSGQLLTNVLLTGIRKTSYVVFVSVSDGKDGSGDLDTDPVIDATTAVTIYVGVAPPPGGRPTPVPTPGSTPISTIVPSTGGSSSGGGGGGGGSRRATPTPTPSPTPTATPTPTGPRFSGQIAADPSVSATVVPEGTTLGLNGGGDLPGGIYVNFPPNAVALPVQVSVSVISATPTDVTAPSGTTLLPLTINITPETPLTLGEPLTIEINPTPEQLAAARGDLNKLSVGVVTPNGIVVLPAQAMHGRLVVTTDRIAPFVLLAVTAPGPTLTQPPMGDASSMGPLLQWTQSTSTTWFQVQVIPFNEDGPGINLVIGDRALVRGAQYQVLGPNFGSADPNYVMLPGMTYLWRVRTATVLTNPTEADWSAWAVSSFKTPPASSSTITPVAPPAFAEVSTLTPTLTWANSNTALFYYEVQVSKDYEFGPNAFLYSEYVHGGASTPPNSYVDTRCLPARGGRDLLLAGAAADSGRRRPATVERYLRVPGATGIGRRLDER